MTQPTSVDNTSATQTEPTQEAHASRWVLPIVAVGVLLTGFDLFIVNVALTDLARDLEVEALADLSWVLNAYTIAFAALLIPAGRVSDRFGAKGTFLAGLIVFVIASALCAASPNLMTLVMARLIQALGAAVMLPSSLGLLLATTPPARRAGVVRLWAGLGGLGAALGPAIGGLLVQIDWRWVFLINVPVGILAIAFGWRKLPQVQGHAGPRPRVGGSLLLIATVAAAVSALVNGPDWGWTSAATIGFAVGSAVGAAIVAATIVKGRDPIVDLAVLAAPQFAPATVKLLAFHVAFGSMLLSSVLWMQGVWGYSALQAGLALVPGPILVPIVAILAGHLGDRVAVRHLVVIGGLIFTAGIISWAVLASPTSGFVATMLPGGILTGIGVGLVVPSSMAYGTAHLPANRFATGSAVLSTARQIGIALGVAALVALLGAEPEPSTFTMAWWVTAGIALIAAIPTRTSKAAR